MIWKVNLHVESRLLGYVVQGHRNTLPHTWSIKFLLYLSKDCNWWFEDRWSGCTMAREQILILTISSQRSSRHILAKLQPPHHSGCGRNRDESVSEWSDEKCCTWHQIRTYDWFVREPCRFAASDMGRGWPECGQSPGGRHQVPCSQHWTQRSSAAEGGTRLTSWANDPVLYQTASPEHNMLKVKNMHRYSF